MLDLIHLGQCLSQHGQDHIQKEERANHHEKHWEQDGHPSDIWVHHVVHDLGPALEGDHLKNRNQADGQIVENGDSIINQLIILNVVDLKT